MACQDYMRTTFLDIHTYHIILLSARNMKQQMYFQRMMMLSISSKWILGRELILQMSLGLSSIRQLVDFDDDDVF